MLKPATSMWLAGGSRTSDNRDIKSSFSEEKGENITEKGAL
jgi:hypothetical protein